MDNSPSRDGFRAKTVNGKNFESWKFSVNIALGSHNLVPIFDGSRTRLIEAITNGVVTNQPAIGQWVKDDNLAQSYLFNTCNEEQQNSLLTREMAHSILNSHTSRYQQNNVESRKSLQQDFLNYRFKPEHTGRSHIEAIKLLVHQFKDAGGLADDDGTSIKSSPLYQQATTTFSQPGRAPLFWKERWPTSSPDLIEKSVRSHTAMAMPMTRPILVFRQAHF
jgi:hypothetical protein